MARPFLAALVLAACNPDAVTLDGSSVAIGSTVWSGTVALGGAAQIGGGEAVVIEAGTVVEVAPGTRLLVLGSLSVEGTKEAPVVFSAPGGWSGISVEGGTLVASYLQIIGPGGPIASRDGTVQLTDSLLDLQRSGMAPDCTSINGGELSLDHVRITGCHCPIHINSAGSATVLDSVLDGAAVPVMLARLDAAFHGNVFDGTGSPMQDVGGSITADVAGNYWGGGAPEIQTSNPSQFTGADDWLAAPPPGAGPR